MIRSVQEYVPEPAWPHIQNIIRSESVVFKVSKPRKTKLADHRPPHGKITFHRISINNNLNPYAFLITLLHEIAHMQTWNLYGPAVEPHGPHWKMQYTNLLREFQSYDLFPKDLNKAITNFCSNPKASSCYDADLHKSLRNFDQEVGVLLEDLPLNTHFSFHNRTFKKIEKLRTRFKCFCPANNKYYLIHGMAEVNPLS